MPRPAHVSLLHLLREISRAGIVDDVIVAVELQSNDFDSLLQHLQSQPGAANKPTDVGENSFCIDIVEVRRI